MMLFPVLVACVLALAAAHNKDDCGDPKDAKVGDTCRAKPLDLRPAQFVLGYLEVECRTKKIEDEYAAGSLDKYLKDHTVPLVATSENYFVLDHHHLLASLLAADIPNHEKHVYVSVTETYSATSDSDPRFWSWLLNSNDTYNDYNFKALPPQFIPKVVTDLLNDPWRGLCYFVRKMGGYGPTNPPTYFQDFMWGKFFRANLPEPTQIASAGLVKYCSVDAFSEVCIGNSTRQMQWLNAVLDQALKLTKSPMASSLPGYGLGSVTPPDCQW